MATARDLVVERNLVRAAFEHLTVDAFMALPFEALGPTKALLKRFFSPQAWTPGDDEALAEAVGPGEGWWRRHLDAQLVLEYGWGAGRFGVRVVSTATPDPEPADGCPPSDSHDVRPRNRPGPDPLAESFDGPVVPEATPNPRTIRFQVGSIHDGPSRWYDSAPGSVPERNPGSVPERNPGSVPEPGVRRLFAEFAEVANVLVGPDFVAVGLRRPDDWERLLLPVLAVVTEEFASPAGDVDRDGPPRVMGGPAGAGAGSVPERNAGSVPERNAGSVPERNPGSVPEGGPGRRLSRLEQAWRDLGALRPADAGDLARVRAVAHDDDPARRQVAANLLREADADVAAAEWARLASDPVRSVRRATADAMVDVNRQELRPLLEAALADTDPWVRWKVLRGLAQLGAGPSRHAIASHAGEPDFRVRLEVAAVLRSIA